MTALAPLRVAAVQCSPVPGDVPANAAEHARLVEEAADATAQLVLFPALSITGYEPDLIDLHRLRVDAGDTRLESIRLACRSRHVHALVGAPVTGPTPGVDGRAGPPRGELGVPPRIGVLHVDSSGGVACVYHQRFLDPGEIGIFGAGNRPGVLDINGWRIGLATGNDVAVPEHAGQLAGPAGVKVYLVGALYRVGAESRLQRQLSTAAAMGLWTVLAQYCGGTGGGPACGGSGGWTPDGQVAVQLGRDPGLALVEISPSRPVTDRP